MDSSQGHHFLRHAVGLALTVGLLSSCGGGGGDDGADDGGYGAPASTAAGPTTDQATDQATDDATDEATDDDMAAPVTVVISDFAYDVPDAVAPGAEITVRNDDNVGHTVTSDDDGATFDVAVGPGEEVTFTAPDEPGDYDFFCRPHPNMTATLVVEEG
ncbi:cupredoxin domain-containing protein [Ornithinimicrobium tianjinense]|uniref:EfeO-type cupredoxin-like domain-containing protein n=1 Tax=Ornithinimicrobium tianjinense TaxID=1195761 RepID=A0A917BGW7_9MICO|nr:cupredoxin domain-containing protein [Ornithinimicrobium tianjinense]GGF41866.1 hypothetical protein GCM10011366_07000 [Ornithinimicrobium tianjinense]